MTIRPIYLQLSVNYADEPEMRALCEYGADGLLARDLAVGLECYCRRNLTDGLVPSAQAHIIMYPLPRDHVTKLVSLLETNLVIDMEAGGFRLRKYTLKYGTREETEKRAETHRAAGKLGGRPAGKRAGRAPGNGHGKQLGYDTETNGETKLRAGARAKPETESESKKPRPPYPPADRAPSAYNGGRGGGDLVTQAQALMAVQGFPIDHATAERITWELLGSRDDIAHPAAYIAARISTVEQARELAPRDSTTSAPWKPPPPRAHPKTDRLIADAFEDRLGGVISAGAAALVRENFAERGITDPAEMISAIETAPDPRALLPPRKHVPGRTVAAALSAGVAGRIPATQEQRDKHAADAKAWLEQGRAEHQAAVIADEEHDPVAAAIADDDRARAKARAQAHETQPATAGTTADDYGEPPF